MKKGRNVCSEREKRCVRRKGERALHLRDHKKERRCIFDPGEINLKGSKGFKMNVARQLGIRTTNRQGRQRVVDSGSKYQERKGP